MCRYIGDGHHLSGQPAALLASAMHGLDRYYDFVGLTELYDHGTHVLGVRLALPPETVEVMRGRYKNVNPRRRAEGYTVSRGEYALLAQRCALDLQLYPFVAGRYLERHHEIEPQVHALRRFAGPGLRD